MIKKGLSKKSVISALIGILLIVGVFLVFTFFIHANRTVSPNHEYVAWYNRFLKVITVETMSTHTESNFANCESPTFFWSPNGKFLAMTTTDTADGNQFSQIMDLKHHDMCLVPTKSTIQTYIQKLNNEPQPTEKNLKNAIDTTKWSVKITKWLDNKNVVVEFSWPSDKPNNTTAGKFVFEVSTYSMKQFTTAG